MRNIKEGNAIDSWKPQPIIIIIIMNYGLWSHSAVAVEVPYTKWIIFSTFFNKSQNN